MSNGIVLRLRCYAGQTVATLHRWIYAEAADFIEAQAARIAELEAALEKQEAITKEDAKWSMVYHQWCVMNGCPPSSSNLIAALDVLEEKKVMTKQTTPFQLTVEENNANHSLNVIVLQKCILEAALVSARLEGMEEAAKIAADYEAVAYQKGDLPINDPNECAAQTAREIAGLIRAALAGGKE